MPQPALGVPGPFQNAGITTPESCSLHHASLAFSTNLGRLSPQIPVRLCRVLLLIKPLLSSFFLPLHCPALPRAVSECDGNPDHACHLMGPPPPVPHPQGMLDHLVCW